MSTIIASNLQASGGTGTAATLASINGGPIAGARNRIINGDMRIDQRNAGATITGGTGWYSVDRWNNAFAASGKFNYGQSTTAPAGFTHSLLHTVAAAYTAVAGDYMLLQHYIEGYNVADLGFGAAGAQSITISFWVRSSVTGTYSVAISNGADNRAYITTFTVNSANTFEYKSVTIPGDTTGTWLKDNGKGISLKFDLGSGSNYVGASTNTWLGTNTFKASGSVSLVANAGATFYLTGVQLEQGNVSTPFERRPIGHELMLAQRYYQKSYEPNIVPGSNVDTFPAVLKNNARLVGQLQNDGHGTAVFYFPVVMRAAPTVNTWTTTGAAGVGNLTVGNTGYINTYSAIYAFEKGIHFQVSASGVSAGAAYITAIPWTASAEL